ncbi:MAG: 50S ribosomal protein L3 [Omnitrophica WOR_2 bacterium RIFCSPHIGHO2_02_FULL_48_11]|nr:MAG: 50S ribosomal protein L3 [Omnitrophica WOR_2 bacterium RIFCSPHIGHO2_02_FULL_48_11]
MIQGLFARKVGMTQIFDKESNVIPVTVLQAGPCVVLNLIDAPRKKIQLGFEQIKENRAAKPQLGFFKKIGVNPMRYMKEFDSTDNANYKVGQELKADVFKAGDYVNVSGFSIGKGFQGGMRRWNWSGGPASHGSMQHRRVGSIGSSSDPSRVFKGHHMPGQMGDDYLTIQNLRVMKVDVENNLVLVAGAVPGKAHNCVVVMFSKKKLFKSLDEEKVVHVVKKNPMKQSKAAVGKAKK